MAIFNPKVKTVVIEGGAFQKEVAEREIMAVPMVFLNGKVFGSGRMSVEEIVARLDTNAGDRDAARLNAKDPFDVLIVGGGPSGAAAAVYAARKGIRTGIVAERFGGQTLDTLGIENYISVMHTEGPKFAAALEAQVRANDVDLINGQRVAALEPAGADGLAGVRLENGAVLKGKQVAVIGGGNSGVEAAIDLAGVVRHVTLIEFADQLKADAVLVKKLKSLPNVTIHVNAQTTEITGDGQKVDGLRWKDRASGTEHHEALAGVFVQIGLVPNTDWLKGTLELSRFGEVIIDERCATSLPGVFAAGDVTTVPYKQIVIAAGEGAKAALSAFDHLIRHA
jgi:alkyl hydroperoxide reductase subunit F